MDHDDKIESLAAPKRNKTRGNGDRVLMVSGFALATMAALFPWYVFFNEESFGVSPKLWDGSRHFVGRAKPSNGSASPLATPDENAVILPQEQMAPFDSITTATVTDGPGGPDSNPLHAGSALNQEFPGEPQFSLIHVANGRALIEDASGMYMVRVGSVLPDNSVLSTMEERDGKWVIITSKGDVIGN